MEKSTAQVIAETLAESGVRYVFGHPGGEVVDLIEALTQGGLEFILTGHESAAAFMAGTVGRLTGSPGVCVATLGPGACNLLLGVASAYLDRDPLLAVTARTATPRVRISNKQNLPLNSLFAPVTKWSLDLEGASTEETIRLALATAARPPRGPVYLSLPADVAVATDRPGDAVPGAPASVRSEGKALPEIIRVLGAARRPVGVIGPALDPDRDTPFVRRFFAETGIPYVVLPQGKGVADEGAAGFLGTIAPGAGDSPLVAFLEASDCLLGVGFDPVESSQSWHFHRPLYSIANAPVGFGNYHPAAECTGDVAELLEQVREALGRRGEGPAGDYAEVRGQVAKAIRPAGESTAAGLSPFHVMRTLRGAMPEETILTTDVGAHKMLVAQAWRACRPRTFLVSNGLSAMGYGVPAALVAALLCPTQPVVAIVGDGGFAMMAQELETARRMRVAPLLVVLCDRSLAIIKMAQKARGISFRGVDFEPVDWAKVAEGFGARGITASTLGEVEQAAQDWLARRELTVMAVPIDELLYSGQAY